MHDGSQETGMDVSHQDVLRGTCKTEMVVPGCPHSRVAYNAEGTTKYPGNPWIEVPRYLVSGL